MDKRDLNLLTFCYGLFVTISSFVVLGAYHAYTSVIVYSVIRGRINCSLLIFQLIGYKT